MDHVIANYDHGLLLDIHGMCMMHVLQVYIFNVIVGQTHSHERVELGYLLHKSDLAGLSDQAMDKAITSRSSIQALARVSPLLPHELLRGDGSLGDLLETFHSSIRTIPSPSHPYPLSDERYFRGGYITQRYHTSSTMDAIQLELPKHLRFTQQGRDTIAAAIADAACYMLETYYYATTRRWKAKL